MAKLRELLSDKFEKRRLVTQLHADLSAALIGTNSALPTLPQFTSCADDQPCSLEGCPKCLRSFRRKLVREAHRQGFDHEVWTSVSIFPSDWKISAGGLARVDLVRQAAHALDGLKATEAGCCMAIGGINVVFVENEDSPGPGVWQLQLNAMLRSELEPSLEAQLSLAFPAVGFGRGAILREVPPEHFHEALTACYKSRFSRRQFSSEQPASSFSGGRRTSRDTALPREQQLELSEWLLTFPVGSRLVLRNLHRVKRRDMKMRLKLAEGAA
jgi:hypothetical protein